MKLKGLFCLALILAPVAVGFASESGEFSELSKSLFGAATDGNMEQVTLLLSRNADINSKDPYGMTLLHIAALRGHVGIVEILVAKGADVEAKDNFGRTPLHYASGAGGLIAREERVDIIDSLLNRGASINATDSLQWTPLHYAAYRLRKSTVELLIRRGADANIQDKRGRTPFLIIQGRPTEFRGLEGAEPYLKKIQETKDFMRGAAVLITYRPQEMTLLQDCCSILSELSVLP